MRARIETWPTCWLREARPQAEYHYRKAIYHNPNYATAHFDYGVALAGLERYDQARAQFEAAVRLDPKLADAHNKPGRHAGV